MAVATNSLQALLLHLGGQYCCMNKRQIGSAKNNVHVGAVAAEIGAEHERVRPAWATGVGTSASWRLLPWLLVRCVVASQVAHLAVILLLASRVAQGFVRLLQQHERFGIAPCLQRKNVRISAFLKDLKGALISSHLARHVVWALRIKSLGTQRIRIKCQKKRALVLRQLREARKKCGMFLAHIIA